MIIQMNAVANCPAVHKAARKPPKPSHLKSLCGKQVFLLDSQKTGCGGFYVLLTKVGRTFVYLEGLDTGTTKKFRIYSPNAIGNDVGKSYLVFSSELAAREYQEAERLRKMIVGVRYLELEQVPLEKLRAVARLLGLPEGQTS